MMTVEKSDASGAASVVYESPPSRAPLGGLPWPSSLSEACGIARQMPFASASPVSFSHPSCANCVKCCRTASPAS